MYTLEQLNDLEEIRKVRSLYSHFYDANDLENLMDLFTEDAVCEWDEKHGGTWVGKAKIREKYQYFFDLYSGYFKVMHAVTNEWVELTGPCSAEGRCFLLDYNFIDSGKSSPLGTVGIYDDEYKKVDGKWKIYRTRIDFLWPDYEVIGGIPGHRIAGKYDTECR